MRVILAQNSPIINQSMRVKMDILVKPMVKYFNDIGLKTVMSCSGHVHLDGRKSLFWITFDKNLTEEDFVDFWNKVKPNMNGWFVKRLWPGPKYNDYHWAYIAGNPWSAYQDLRLFKKKNPIK